MKVSKQIFVATIITVLIVPQITFAAWWNPFSWFKKNSPTVQQIQPQLPKDEVNQNFPATKLHPNQDKTQQPVTPKNLKPAVSLNKARLENKNSLALESSKLTNKKIIATVKPAIVYLETDSGSGSGMIFDNNGFILTNAHVVSGTNQARAILSDGRSFMGTVIGRDEIVDLAVVQIQANGLSHVSFGDSDSVEQGDQIFTLGYPFGLEGDVSFKEGTISRRVNFNGVSYLEISAEIHPGNSGGPLVDETGKVIGINSLAVGSGSTGALRFAIPINKAKSLIPELENGRSVINPRVIIPAPIPQAPAPVQPVPQPYVPAQVSPIPYVPPTVYVPPAYQPPPVVVPQIGSFTNGIEKTTSYLRSDGYWVYQFRVKFANKSGDIITWCYNDPSNPAGGGSSFGGMWYVGSDEIRNEVARKEGGNYSCVFLMNPQKINGAWNLDQNGTPKSDAISSKINFTLPVGYPSFYFKKWGGNEPDENIPPAP